MCLGLRTKPLITQQRSFFVVVELPCHDRHGDTDFIGNPLQIAPNADVPIRIGIVGMRNPVAIVIQPLAQDGHIGFHLRPVQVEIIVVLSYRLSGLPLRTADVFLCVVDTPAAHDIFPEKAGTETGDMPVDTIMAQVHSFEFRNGIRDQPACQGRIGCPENADGLTPGLAGNPLVQRNSVFPLIDIRAVESFRSALPPAVLLDVADAATGILPSEGIVVPAPAIDIRCPRDHHRPGALSLRKIDPRQEFESAPARHHLLGIGISVACRDR